MPLQNIGIVYRKELTEALRGPRPLFSTLVVPLLLFPLMSVGFIGLAQSLEKKAEQKTPKVMLLGGADSPQVLEMLRKMEKIEIVPTTPEWKNEIIEKRVQVVIAIPDGFQSSLEQQKSETIEIYKYRWESKSSTWADNIEIELKEFSKKGVESRLEASHVPASVLTPFKIEQENVAPPEKVGGETFGGLIAYMVILLCMIGGMYPAMDLTAGEKERGTMETILSSPISRVDLVLGKFFLVLSTTLVTAALSVFSMGISFSVLRRFNMSSGRGDAAALLLQLGPK